MVNCVGVYPTMAVPRVEETCAWYVEKLGFSLRFLYGEPPRHGAILLGEACVHFWEGPPQLNENWLYFDVDDLAEMHRRAQENGVEITKAPQDYEWGMREFNAVDLNGYKIRFGQHLGKD